MSKPERVLVTGVTGFLGSHLACRLLHEGRRVVALARGSKSESARQRVLQVLERVTAGDLNDFAERLDVLEGDIAQPDLGMSPDVLASAAETIAETWHCAASLSFGEDERDEIFRMNVDGARRIVELAARTPGRRLHHVSTAYVAGLRDLALESEIDVGQRFRNPYEESKCRAEELVAAAHGSGSIDATVYRPSVVIGDSRSGRATHFHGVYAFIRGLWAGARRLRRKSQTNGVVRMPLRVLGNEDTTLNFVPIDYVVGGMTAIGKLESSSGRTYHLANPNPTRNRVWVQHICRLLGVEGVRIAGPDDFIEQPMTRIELLFQRQMAFYYMYLQGEPRFDCSNALAALRPLGIECAQVTEEFIDRMVGWYIDFLEKSEQQTL